MIRGGGITGARDRQHGGDGTAARYSNWHFVCSAFD
jgi:hypothetical protein